MSVRPRAVRKKKSRTLDLKVPRWAKPLLARGRFKGAFGGRGSGKSHWFATMVVLAHVRNANRRTVCIRETQRSLDKSVKQLIEDKIRQLGVGRYFEVKADEIRCRKGSGVILFQGMAEHTAESIKSLEGFDCAWVEEAQKFSQKSLDLLRPTIRKPGSEIWFTWNPIHEDDPVNAFLRGPDRPSDAIVVEVHYLQNPWVTDVLLAEAAHDQRTNRAKYEYIWLGQYEIHAEARVFTNWLVQEFVRPKGTIFRFGVDWGFSPDPIVMVRISIDGQDLYVDYEAWEIECEIEGTRALFLTIPESERWPIRAGRDRPERIRSARKAGFKIYASVSAPGSVIEGVEWLQGFHRIIVHPRCTHITDSLRLYSRKVDPLTGKVLPVLQDEEDHGIEALRYAGEDVMRMANNKPAGPITPEPVASRWGGR